MKKNSEIKIIFITGQRLEDTGGGNKIVTEIINQLARRNNVFSYSLIDIESRILEKQFPSKIIGSGLDNSVNFFAITSLFFKRNIFILMLRLLKTVKRENPDIIIDVTGPVLKTVNLFILRLFIHKNRPQYIFFDHSPVKTLLKHSRFYWMYSILAPWIYRRANMVASVSRELVSIVARDYGISTRKVAYIYNPINSNNILNLASDIPQKDWFKEEERKKHPIIITACRLDESQKNVSLLIRAFAGLKQEYSCRLAIIGDGPQKKFLEKLSKDLKIDNDIWFCGYDKNPYKYIMRSDIFVLSTKFEALPLVLGEAMACGCPVISSDCDFGPREILENGKDGILVPVGDTGAMSVAIIDLLSNQKKRKEYIARGHERVKDFSLEKTIDEYEAMFKRVLGGDKIKE